MKAIITGASSGLGRDFARLLSERGYTVILVARSKQKLERLAQQLPNPAEIVCLDLSEPQACFELYEAYQNQSISLLINNAGFGSYGFFDETDLQKELNMIDLNLKAVHILTKLFTQKMIRQNHGIILNVASSAGFFPGPKMATYYATKAYVVRLTESVREELRRRGKNVQLSVLCPGPVNTNFNRRAGVRFALSGLPSAAVAAYALDELFAGKAVIIPGLAMKLAKLGARLLPDVATAWFSYFMQSKKDRS